MQTTTRDKILVAPDRQRKEIDPKDVQELLDSMIAKGLMHAPVMRNTDNGLRLVAGEHRVRAIELAHMLGQEFRYNGEIVPKDQYPYVTLGDLNEIEAEEAELEENLRRVELSWQDQSAAMAKLHALRSKQAQAEGRVQTVADTAMEVKGRSDGSFQDTVRKELIVSQHLDNPLVAKAKDVNEAFKILKKQEEQTKNVQLAAEVGKTFNKDVHKAFNVNCCDWMESAQPEMFDVILTDPPYGMGAQDFGDGGDGRMHNSEHHYDDSLESFIALMKRWCPLSFKVAKAQAHAYVFCDIQNFPLLKQMMEEAGWYVFRTPMIAHKPLSGRVPLPQHGPRRQYETLLYAIKGKKTTTCIKPDVISTTQDAATTHGAQKPVALYVDLLSRSVRPGDKVADFFSGSGTIFEAAHQMKCEAYGFELNPEYFAMGLKRMQNLDKVAVAPNESAALMNELKGMM